MAKREASNIYKLSDLAPGDQQPNSDVSGETGTTPVSTVPADKDCAEGEAAGLAHPNTDDALAWLKIIQHATADLTADLRASKGEDFAGALTDDAEPSVRNSASSQAAPAPRAGRRSASLHDEARHDDFSDERKLAQKLSYRNIEPRQVSPQSLRAALLPYVAATGVLAFIAGSAAVYFLTGSSAADVKTRGIIPAVETQIEEPLVRLDQSAARKSGSEKAAATPWGVKAEDVAAQPADPRASGGRQLESWSDTVATFKQFVKPEQK